jgi:hypothetical protein
LLRNKVVQSIFRSKVLFLSVLVRATVDYAVAYRNPTTSADACTSNENDLVRLDQQVCNVLQHAIVVDLNLLQRHGRRHTQASTQMTMGI